MPPTHTLSNLFSRIKNFRQKFNKKIFFGALVVVLLSPAAVFSVYKFLAKAPQTTPPFQSESTPTEIPVTLPSVPTPDSSGKVNILLLGQGDPSHEGSGLTDSLMIVHLDTTNKKAALIFLPRDLWVPLPAKTDGKSEVKINETYRTSLTNGDSSKGLKLIEEIASAITGLPIQYSLLIDFNGFTQVINSIGGIDININSSFDDYYYPIAGRELDNCGMAPETLRDINATISGFLLEKQYSCRYEHIHFDSGKTHVTGETALKFARSRHSAQGGSDFARGERQQILLLGIKDKLISLEALKNVDKYYNNFVKKMKLDMDLNAAKSLVLLVIDPKDYKISQIVPSEDNVLSSSKNSAGQFILIPKAGNWTEFQGFIKKQMQ
ncbi:MAG: LCP family protein [bacterium]|nr:LCP family protein [bacterium]